MLPSLKWAHCKWFQKTCPLSLSKGFVYRILCPALFATFLSPFSIQAFREPTHIEFGISSRLSLRKQKLMKKATSHSDTQTLQQERISVVKFSEAQWKDLNVHPDELRPEFTLIMGQCFNWREVSGGWLGVVGQRVLSVRQTPTSTEFACLVGSEDCLVEDLHDYFQLETQLVPLYKHWSKKDSRLKAIANVLPGVRVLRQDPLECVISFICSSNNNILRITKMLETLRSRYGTPLGDIVVKSKSEDYEQTLQMYAFPTIDQLALATEEELRNLGFGYRAKFIVESTRIMKEQPSGWLESLRQEERLQAQESLMKLSGVGRKVADCIALFCADQTSSIPVDTHVWRIACRDYDPSLRECKSLTPTVYERVGDLFRKRFGNYAGWAHSLLFAAEIPNFKDLLPEEIKLEMEAFRLYEKQQKELEKQLKKEAKPEKITKPTKHAAKKKKARKSNPKNNSSFDIGIDQKLLANNSKTDDSTQISRVTKKTSSTKRKHVQKRSSPRPQGLSHNSSKEESQGKTQEASATSKRSSKRRKVNSGMKTRKT